MNDYCGNCIFNKGNLYQENIKFAVACYYFRDIVYIESDCSGFIDIKELL